MSAITNKLPVAGDTATAAAYNAEQSAYTEGTGGLTYLSADNMALGGLDLPQFASGMVFVAADTANIGSSDLNHSSVTTINQTSPPAPVATSPAVAFPSLIATPLNVAVGEVLRVYFQCGAWAGGGGGFPWDSSTFVEQLAPGALGSEINSSWCWVGRVQYASTVTLGVPSGWTDMPGQDDFLSVYGSLVGSALEDCPATAVISAWTMCDSGLGANGSSAAWDIVDAAWQVVSGAFFYTPTSTFGPIYGFRVVFMSGVYHPYFNSATNKNWLVWDELVRPGNRLEIGQGSLTYHVMKEG